MAEESVFTLLDPLFHPKSVALIGASEKPGKVGRLIMEQFLKMGFPTLYPVNPSETRILGVKAFPRITDIPGPVDMAMVLTPTHAVLQAVEECATKGVKLIVITTSGFSEAGERGKALEQEIVRVARKGGARIIGPNCVGIYSPAAGLPYPLGPPKKEGSVGLVSQSGFFADYITLTTGSNGIYFSKAISCGNEADLNAVDFLEYLGEDPNTEIILAYLEGVSDGRRFYDVARNISKKKPIILWKGGITEGGAAAAVSHTGALAGSRAVWEGVLRQAGVIAVRTFEEAIDTLYLFRLQPLPQGKRVGIVSGPGGMAVGTTDICLDIGLEIPQFSGKTSEKLRKVVPSVGGSARNPVDLSLVSFVAPQVYGDALRFVAEDEKVDMLLVISVAGGEQIRDTIIETVSRTGKPVVLTLMAGTTQSVAQDVPLFLKAGIPIYSDPARAARALGRLWEYTQFRRRSEDGTERSATHRKGVNAEQEEGADVVTRALKEGRTALSEHESKELLHAHGIPVTREQEACDEPGFRQALSDIRFPLVVKGCGPGLSHKTERGLVYVNVSTEEEAMTVFREIRSKMKNEVGSVMVQEMVKGTRELIMGFLRDGQFGPCVMFGLGGIFAEALGDISFRPVPLEKQDAVDMLHEIKAFKILGPYRNMPAADIDELACMLMHLGTIGLEEPRIKEIDVNPVILSGSRPVAVDALIVLNP